MANEITIGGLQLEFTDKGSTQVAEDLEKLARALEAMKSASQGGGLTSKTKQLNALISAIDNIKSESVERLNSLAQSITAIGAVSPSDNVVKIFTELRKAINGVDTSKVEDIKESVSGSAFSDSKGAEEAKANVDGINEKVAQGKESAEAFSDGIDDVKESMDGLNDNAVKDTSKSFDDAKASAEGVTEKVGQAKESARAFKRSVETINGSKYKEVETAFGKMYVSADMSEKKIKSLVKTINGIGKAKEGVKKVAGGVKKLGSALIGANSFAGKLLKSFVRIAFYRSIRFALSSMVKGFKEGATNLYAWSNAFDKTRTFANSMDRIATAILYVKNSLGAMVAPIINYVAPAIDFLADKFVGLINWVNEFISALTGASTYTVARKIGAQFQEIADGAGQASKAIHSFTIGIDELNIIEDTGRDGGGYGGLGNVAQDWFEKKEVSRDMQDIADVVKEKVEDINFAVQWLKTPEGWQAFKESVIESSAAVGAFVTGLPLGLKVIEWVGNKGADVIEWLVAGWEKVKKGAEWVGNFGADIIENFVNTYKAIGEFGKDFAKDVGNLWTAIGRGVEGAVGKVLDTVHNKIKKVKGVVQDIADIVSNVFGAFTNNRNRDRSDRNNRRSLSDLVMGNKAQEESKIRSRASSLAQFAVNELDSSMQSAMYGHTPNLDVIKFLDVDKNKVGRYGSDIGGKFASGVQTGMVSKNTALRQTAQNLAYNAISQFSSSHNIEQFKIGGQNLVAGIIQGLDSKKGQLYNSLNKVATDAYEAFKKGALIKSPSRLFAEGGKFIVLGLNKGIEDNEGTTKKVVNTWLDTFSNIKPSVDFSNLALPNIGEIATSVSGSIRTNTSLTTQVMTGEVEEFFTNTLMPVVRQISDDTKRQADKDENVVLDGRKMTDSINKRNRTNGYSFT